MTKQNQIAPMANNATQLPAEIPAELMQAVGQDVGLGWEEVDNESSSVPYIYLLQALSPAVQNCEDGTVRAGMFLNSATGEVLQNLTFIPCHFQRRYNRWSPDGHWMGAYLPSEIEGGAPNISRDGFAYYIDGDQLTDTRMHYVLYLGQNGWEPAIISLSRTQVKQSKRLVTMMRTAQINGRLAPQWAFVYEATSFKEKNEKGQWFSWQFRRVAPVTELGLYMQAKNFYESVATGGVQASAMDAEQF